jgi:hypothetical protein
MNSKRPSVMKSTARAGAGGAVVIGALLALLFLRGGGGSPGPDSETNSGTPMVTTETDQTATEIPAKAPSQSDSSGGLTADEEKALSGELLSILIDERSYLMAVPTDSEPIYRPTELSRLLKLAALAEGDSNGIRVRILQRETARVSAKEDLKAELAKIGISSDAVYTQAEFIP